MQFTDPADAAPAVEPAAEPPSHSLRQRLFHRLHDPPPYLEMFAGAVNSEKNSMRIAQMESCFGMNGVPLNVPGRVLVGEGVLTKICRKKPKARQFFLFNDILVYGTILINKKKYAQQHLIPLEGLTLEDVPDSGEYKNGWMIKTPTKSFVVYAVSASDKTDWMGHIRNCANDLLKHSGKIAIHEHAAVWVPDSGARICMHCNSTHFTILNRRHHCRSCGAVICGNCSKNRLVILHQSNKPVRVCDRCHAEANDHLNRFRQPSVDSQSALSIPSRQSLMLVGDQPQDERVVDELAECQLRSVRPLSTASAGQPTAGGGADSASGGAAPSASTPSEDASSDSEEELELTSSVEDTLGEPIAHQTTFYGDMELDTETNERPIDVPEALRTERPDDAEATAEVKPDAPEVEPDAPEVKPDAAEIKPEVAEMKPEVAKPAEQVEELAERVEELTVEAKPEETAKEAAKEAAFVAVSEQVTPEKPAEKSAESDELKKKSDPSSPSPAASRTADD